MHADWRATVEKVPYRDDMTDEGQKEGSHATLTLERARMSLGMEALQITR